MEERRLKNLDTGRRWQKKNKSRKVWIQQSRQLTEWLDQLLVALTIH